DWFSLRRIGDTGYVVEVPPEQMADYFKAWYEVAPPSSAARDALTAALSGSAWADLTTGATPVLLAPPPVSTAALDAVLTAAVPARPAVHDTTTHLAARILKQANHGTSHRFTLELRALDLHHHLTPGNSHAVQVKILKAPAHGKVALPHGGIHLRHGVARPVLTANVSGTYLLQITAGKLTTAVEVVIRSR
ncbi:MAG TPA: hypothetical protein VFD32_01785, partial [Dehalococcoidia bacterium]|nr:hypothetical protein [Dehalococcoidia bacterium]